MATDCHKCRHYHITWDENAPHGCRAFGFKGKQLPSLTVRSASAGRECLLFKPKAATSKPRSVAVKKNRLTEPVSNRFSLAKVKAGENVNRRNTSSILRIKI